MDSAIEQRLRAIPADLWHALWAAVDEMNVGAETGTWSGGDPTATSVDSGVPQTVMSMPYVTYSDAVNRVVAALYDAGVIVVFNWPEWEGLERCRGHALLEHGKVADAVRMLTAIVRAERFSEGSIAMALEDGTFESALARIRRWHSSDDG